MNFEFVPYEAEHGAQPLSGGNSYENNLKWSQYTPEQAAGKKPMPHQRTFASSIPLDHLKVSAEQLHQIQEIYRRDATAVDGPVDLVYSTNDDDQLAASAIMAQQGFDIDAQKTAGPESTERPTIRAATAVADLLREDTAGPVDPESDDDSDDAAPADFEEDVDTDASSDSGDEDDDESAPSQRTSTNLEALGDSLVVFCFNLNALDSIPRKAPWTFVAEKEDNDGAVKTLPFDGRLGPLLHVMSKSGAMRGSDWLTYFTVLCCSSRYGRLNPWPFKSRASISSLQGVVVPGMPTLVSKLQTEFEPTCTGARAGAPTPRKRGVHTQDIRPHLRAKFELRQTRLPIARKSKAPPDSRSRHRFRLRARARRGVEGCGKRKRQGRTIIDGAEGGHGGRARVGCGSRGRDSCRMLCGLIGGTHPSCGCGVSRMYQTRDGTGTVRGGDWGIPGREAGVDKDEGDKRFCKVGTPRCVRGRDADRVHIRPRHPRRVRGPRLTRVGGVYGGDEGDKGRGRVDEEDESRRRGCTRMKGTRGEGKVQCLLHIAVGDLCSSPKAFLAISEGVSLQPPSRPFLRYIDPYQGRFIPVARESTRSLGVASRGNITQDRPARPSALDAEGEHRMRRCARGANEGRGGRSAAEWPKLGIPRRSGGSRVSHPLVHSHSYLRPRLPISHPPPPPHLYNTRVPGHGAWPHTTSSHNPPTVFPSHRSRIAIPPTHSAPSPSRSPSPSPPLNSHPRPVPIPLSSCGNEDIAGSGGRGKRGLRARGRGGGRREYLEYRYVSRKGEAQARARESTPTEGSARYGWERLRALANPSPSPSHVKRGRSVTVFRVSSTRVGGAARGAACESRYAAGSVWVVGEQASTLGARGANGGSEGREGTRGGKGKKESEGARVVHGWIDPLHAQHTNRPGGDMRRGGVLSSTISRRSAASRSTRYVPRPTAAHSQRPPTRPRVPLRINNYLGKVGRRSTALLGRGRVGAGEEAEREALREAPLEDEKVGGGRAVSTGTMETRTWRFSGACASAGARGQIRRVSSIRAPRQPRGHIAAARWRTRVGDLGRRPEENVRAHSTSNGL
ncbi:hypothetical protein C8F04DRAFT_1365181 [Mycena alexandri]|uniref:Uncharacterized protein n=1 Tax=Mycena alexandri TaxID=1745969 RepID=A0AAD6SNK2_9AGAR|nr:hypothetical protein C8F04DRAFT_1365181 [Mycena alexandri]